MGLITSKELKYAVIDETIDIEKDLIVKSEIPELFRVGDRIVISNSITNRSGRDLNITLSMKLVDIESGREFIDTEELSKNVDIEDGETKDVDFKLEIPNLSVDRVECIVEVKSKEYKDIFKREVSVVKSRALIENSMLFRLEPNGSRELIFSPIQDINLSTSPYEDL